MWAGSGDGRSPTEEAIRTGKPVYVRNILADEYFTPWREKALEQGYISSAVFPLFINGKVLGALIVCAKEADAFDDEELELLNELTNDISYGISTIRTREERRLAERRITFLQKMAMEIGVSEDFQSALSIVIQRVCEETGWIFGEVWVPSIDASVMTCAFTWHIEDADLLRFAEESRKFTFPPGVGVPGKVWQSRKPEWVIDVTQDMAFIRAPQAKLADLKSCIGIPVMAGEDVVAVLDFFVRDVKEEDEKLIELMSSVARELGLLFNRMQAEEEARERAALLDIANDAILIRDIEGLILYMNKGAEKIYGWTKDEAIGKTVKEILYDPQSDEITEALLKNGYWRGELRQKNKDGEEIILQSKRTLLRDEEGNPKAIFIVNSDITEMKKLEAQLLSAQRLESLGTLASGIAHDLNNVLAPILLAVEFLKNKISEDDASRMLAIVEDSVNRGAHLIKQILAFGRGDMGERASVQLRNLLEEIGKMLMETFPKSINVSVNCAKDFWPVICNRTKIWQVLMNLCVNSKDAMPDGGELNLTAENIYLDEVYVKSHIHAKVGPYVVISVSDTGCGIPPSDIERIFEPFFSAKKPGYGTGLGLSTTYSIVKSHGGFINVYSEVNAGTRIRVYLPAKELPEADEEYRRWNELPRGNGETILVVDDESSILEMTRLTLEAYGYKVFTATDGASAITLFRAHGSAISAIITDVAMPVMDGIATARAIRKINPQARIILASGFAPPARMQEIKALNLDEIIEKPFDARTILIKLAEVIGRA